MHLPNSKGWIEHFVITDPLYSPPDEPASQGVRREIAFCAAGFGRLAFTHMKYQSIRLPRSRDGHIHLEDLSNPIWHQFISTNRHRHSFVEVHLVTRGRAEIIVGNQRVELPPGSILIIPPGKEHMTLNTSSGLKRWILSARASAVRRCLSDSEAIPVLTRRGSPPLAQLGRVELSRLALLFEDVSEQTAYGSLAANAGIAYALTRTVMALNAAEPTYEPATLHPSVARALSLLRGDGLLLSRDELAERCNLSASHLSRLFVQELGQPLRDVRNRKRMERFYHLLATGVCDTRTEAALEAGFGSYSQFHRVERRLRHA